MQSEYAKKATPSICMIYQKCGQGESVKRYFHFASHNFYLNIVLTFSRSLTSNLTLQLIFFVVGLLKELKSHTSLVVVVGVWVVTALYLTVTQVRRD